jgi:hypothetical protein
LYFGYPARISRREEREEKKISPLQISLHTQSLDILNDKAVGLSWTPKVAACTVQKAWVAFTHGHVYYIYQLLFLFIYYFYLLKD